MVITYTPADILMSISPLLFSHVTALTFAHQCNFWTDYTTNSQTIIKPKFDCSDHPATINKPTPCNLSFIVTMYVKSLSCIIFQD